MPLTRDFKDTVIERIRREPEFARDLYDEALDLFLSGKPEAARHMLRTLVNATMGFEGLAAKTAGDTKSLHRMLSPKGNPNMNNLSSIFCAVRIEVELKRRHVSQDAKPVADGDQAAEPL